LPKDSIVYEAWVDPAGASDVISDFRCASLDKLNFLPSGACKFAKRLLYPSSCGCLCSGDGTFCPASVAFKPDVYVKCPTFIRLSKAEAEAVC
jgi:hypothetical protein